MAISYPVALSDLLDLVPVMQVTFDLSEAVETSDLTGGEVIVNDYGPRFWQGVVQIQSASNLDMDQVEARLSNLRQAGRKFLLTPPYRAGPRDDPDGQIISGSSASVQNILDGGSSLVFDGLPNDYVLSVGDFLSFPIGGVSAFFQVTDGAQANINGNARVEVMPAADGGIGGPVTFVRPVLTAVMVPGSYKPASRGLGKSSGPSFMWRESLG